MKQKFESGKIHDDTYLIDIGIMIDWPRVTSIYAVKSEKTVLFDGGTSFGAQGIIKSLKEFDLLPLDYVVISHSHWDHHQAIPAILREMTGRNVELFAHPNAIPLLENPSKVGYDIRMGPLLPIIGVKPLREGDVLNLGEVELEVIETHGHTLDCVSLFDSRNRSLFVGDAIGDKFSVSLPCYPPSMSSSSNKDTYMATLDKLKRYDFDSICLGHFGAFYGLNVKEILSESKVMFSQT